MATDRPRHLVMMEYEDAAEAYLRSLPPEHFMESVPQATQRKISVASLELVHAARPEVQIFNELLVQFPGGREGKPKQVVPDNMVVVWDQPIKARGSYDVPVQPVKPFWMLEYVSKYNKRKDYEDNFRIFERELKIPYYLIFYPDNQELTLYRHTGRKCRSVPANENGRHPIEELDLEVGLVDGWVRFWYKGELLPLPAELQRELEETRRQLQEAVRRADQQEQRADAALREVAAVQRQLAEAQQARQTLERELERLRGRNGNGRR